MGDFNTTEYRLLQPYLGDLIQEEIMSSESDIDRVLYINPKDSTHKLVPINAYYGEGGLSDHRPFIAEFEIEEESK